MRPLLLLGPLPDFLTLPLRRGFACHEWNGAAEDAAESVPAGEIAGLVMGGAGRAPEELLERLPLLEIISIFGVGYDGVPLDYCRRRGIRVCNTPGVLTEDVGDIAVALVLMTARRLVEANRFLHAGEWERGAFPLGAAVRGKVAGIIGLGRIGKAIAHRLAAHGMEIAYTGRSAQPAAYAFCPTVRELAAKSDFLIVACPGGEGTRGLVDAAVLAALGAGGTLINIARGSIVDEAALVAALKGGTIRSAGLDVFADEPRGNPELAELGNVVLLPHVGSGTVETRQAMARLCMENLRAHFAGEPPAAAVC